LELQGVPCLATLPVRLMTVKIVFCTGAILFFVLVWRHFTKRDRMQDWLHGLPGPLKWLLQWYSVMFVGLTLLMGETMYTIIRYTYIGSYMLDPAHFENGASGIHKGIRYISLAGPMVGTLAFLFIIGHVIKSVKASARWREKKGHNKFFVNRREDMVLLVIAMPAVSTIMAVRSVSRMWMVMRGADTLENGGAQMDESLYLENLEFSNVAQFYVVFEFTQLCMTFLAEAANAEYQWAMRFAGFQGVYFWVGCGAIRSIFDFVVAFLRAHPSFSAVVGIPLQAVLDLQILVLEKISTVFSVLTLICVYNMFVICKLSYIKDALGNASLKFMGMRLLLIISVIQPKVLSKLAEYQFHDLTEDNARILHASLLSIECLVVVCFNFYAWEIDIDKDKIWSNSNLLEGLTKA